jgi:hypothetical protein
MTTLSARWSSPGTEDGRPPQLVAGDPHVFRAAVQSEQDWGRVQLQHLIGGRGNAFAAKANAAAQRSGKRWTLEAVDVTEMWRRSGSLRGRRTLLVVRQDVITVRYQYELMTHSFLLGATTRLTAQWRLPDHLRRSNRMVPIYWMTGVVSALAGAALLPLVPPAGAAAMAAAGIALLAATHQDDVAQGHPVALDLGAVAGRLFDLGTKTATVHGAVRVGGTEPWEVARNHARSVSHAAAGMSRMYAAEEQLQQTSIDDTDEEALVKAANVLKHAAPREVRGLSERASRGMQNFALQEGFNTVSGNLSHMDFIGSLEDAMRDEELGAIAGRRYTAEDLMATLEGGLRVPEFVTPEGVANAFRDVTNDAIKLQRLQTNLRRRKRDLQEPKARRRDLG